MARPLVKDASSEKQVRKGKQSEKRREEDERHDLAVVLGSEEGRRVMDRIMAHLGQYRSVFAQENTHVTAYLAGQQDAAHWLFGEITVADPKATLKMMQESGRIDLTPPIESTEPDDEIEE